MKIVITIDDGNISVEKHKPKIGAVTKKPKTEVGKVKKLTVNEKKEKKRMTEDEDIEMVKSLKKLGVEPK